MSAERVIKIFLKQAFMYYIKKKLNIKKSDKIKASKIIIRKPLSGALKDSLLGVSSYIIITEKQINQFATYSSVKPPTASHKACT